MQEVAVCAATRRVLALDLNKIHPPPLTSDVALPCETGRTKTSHVQNISTQI